MDHLDRDGIAIGHSSGRIESHYRCYISNIEQFERFDRYTTLQSLCTALDHQVEDGLMRLQECDRMRFIVGKSWDLKLQIHLLEKGCAQLADIIAHISLMLEDVIPKSVFVTVCTQLYDAALGS